MSAMSVIEDALADLIEGLPEGSFISIVSPGIHDSMLDFCARTDQWHVSLHHDGYVEVFDGDDFQEAMKRAGVDI